MPLPHRSFADARVLQPAGRLDHDNYEAFRTDLAEHESACERDGQTLVIDLSALEYVSSAGLRCFMLAAKEAKARNGRVLLAALQPVVAEIFKISRFNLLFEIFPTVREAVAAVSARAGAAFERG
jgi:anti-sigma B factor antagonist